ncbi:DNA topoisomerase I [Candidatus Woesearchaeota archaeon]|nr:DNA topoisomerase I [Candidatus Woesearchaeota archaeon]
MTELIITEKPQAAKKIADALADGKPIKENNQGVPYYLISHGKKDIIVACAVGHLYGLYQKEGTKKWTYPLFDIEWQASHETRKNAAYTKKYLMTIKKLSKEAKEFTVATDYDIEGEVIGLNVIKYACKKKDASRMKFSTLTKDDLVNAYENKSKTLDWGQANAGVTRHFLDWYNGINYSRALTSAIKTAGTFKLMSIGRVQGPALKTIVEREKEIKAFKPVPFWQIELNGEANKSPLTAWHIEDKFWKKQEVEKVMKKIKGGKEAIVDKIDSSKFNQSPPTPFDLTTLQTEVYRCHRISPKRTLEIAQELYTAGYISYPRTSSQQYPESIGYKKILSALKKNPSYKKLADKILSRKGLKPNDGKKTDPAHPAIYPTGVTPSLDSQNDKIYDIIVRRFLATFSDPAVRETNKIVMDMKDESFIAKGTRTLEKGWHEFYGPYVKLEEEDLPKVKKGDKVKVKKITKHDEETKPPKRYTPASIIRELEKRNLGTKSTRASIVDTLFNRGYVDGKSIQATELGIRTIETLEHHSPKIIDEALSRHFEVEMEEIRKGKKKMEDVLKEAQDALTKILSDFKKKEKDIGKELKAANIETRDALSTIGNCPNCKEGKLQIRRGKYGQFVACNKYPDCKTTFSMPNNALIKPSDKECEVCKHPMVLSIRRAKKPMSFCINPDCKSKHPVDLGKLEKPCPTCSEGKLILRKSLYGSFLGCSSYPKCRHTEQVNGDNKS